MKKITILLVLLSFILSGCAINFYKRSPLDKAKISELQSLRLKEREEFEAMQRELEKKLKGKAELSLEERGLVIILADNILFDSGKAEIKQDAYSTLDKINRAVKEKAPDKNIGIEGHTDNAPIKYSKWRSNRELSTARANNVYHYLVDKGGLDSSKLTTIGYGETRPAASNKTAEGKAKNRRVEIVILPQYSRKIIGIEEEENWVK